MSHGVVRTEEEINDVLNECADAENSGRSKVPAALYEEGVKAGIQWLTGDTNDHPLAG